MMQASTFKKYEKLVEKTYDGVEKDLRDFVERVAYEERKAFAAMLDSFAADLKVTKDKGGSPIVGFDYVISRVRSLREEVLQQ